MARRVVFVFQHTAFVPRPFHQLPEYKGLQRVGDHDGRSHADEGAETDGTDGRMYGEEQRRHHDDEDGRREEDGDLMPREHVTVARSRMGEQAFHDEDAVVDTYAEDEGGDDDADEVEFQADKGHVTLHHEPAEHHGNDTSRMINTNSDEIQTAMLKSSLTTSTMLLQ